MSFHQRLKHERMVKGWSVEQLSEASGVTVNRISMLERNLVEMVSDSLKDQLAKALGVDFQAPPTAPLGSLQEPVTPQSVVTSVSPPALPEPFALHLPTPVQQALEAAARQHGRSLHGEILHRLEHSLQSVGLAPPVATVAASASQVRTAGGVIQLSEADWAHIPEQVALRLQARR